jgi:hypothetical protein
MHAITKLFVDVDISLEKCWQGPAAVVYVRNVRYKYEGHVDACTLFSLSSLSYETLQHVTGRSSLFDVCLCM